MPRSHPSVWSPGPWWRLPGLMLASVPLAFMGVALLMQLLYSLDGRAPAVLALGETSFGVFSLWPILGGSVVLVIGRGTGADLWNTRSFGIFLLLAIVPWWISYQEGREAIHYSPLPPEVPLGPELFTIINPVPMLLLLGAAWWIARDSWKWRPPGDDVTSVIPEDPGGSRP